MSHSHGTSVGPEGAFAGDWVHCKSSWPLSSSYRSGSCQEMLAHKAHHGFLLPKAGTVQSHSLLRPAGDAERALGMEGEGGPPGLPLQHRSLVVQNLKKKKNALIILTLLPRSDPCISLHLVLSLCACHPTVCSPA